MNVWTSCEIKQLEIGFLSGVPMKELARTLGRTPTALNKALTRFGIRHKREIKRATIWAFNASNGHQSITPQSAIKRFDRRHRKYQQELFSQWVPMHDVITLLTSKGHQTKLIKTMNDPRENIYQCDDKKLPAIRLVFMANRYRLEQNEAPFYVHGVTE